MVATLCFKFICRGVLPGLMVFVFIQAPICHTQEKSRPESPFMNAGESSRFIVAFELSEENDFTFTWPLEVMRSAPYKRVLMVVEKMPEARSASALNNRYVLLLASRHLEINGRLQKPFRVTRAQGGAGQGEQFLVSLVEGRLRLKLSIPPGYSLKPQRKIAKIKLYQATGNQSLP